MGWQRLGEKILRLRSCKVSGLSEGNFGVLVFEKQILGELGDLGS